MMNKKLNQDDLNQNSVHGTFMGNGGSMANKSMIIRGDNHSGNNSANQSKMSSSSKRKKLSERTMRK